MSDYQKLDQDSYLWRDRKGATELHDTRTAVSMAGFLLPHLRPGMRLLDCGCGPGSITVGFARFVAPGEVVGVDVDANHIAMAKARAADIPNIRLEVASAYEIPFPDESFDVVFCHSVLEHLTRPERAIAEIRRVLKPEGFFAAREVDTEGLLVTPSEPILYEVRDLWERLTSHHGGDARMGKRLFSLLREGAFSRLRVSATYEVYGASAADTRATPAHILGHWLIVISQARELGWIDTAKKEKMSNAWRDWSAHQDAFIAFPRWEAVAWLK